jgi:CheY-like chemotaxis protein
VNSDQIVQIFDAAGRLVTALSWPVIALVFGLYFGGPLKRFITDVTEGSIKLGAGGIEASAKRRVEAVAALAMAAATKPSQRGSDSGGQRIPATVSEVIGSVTGAIGVAAKILWVDDEPANNVLEVQALEALGARIVRVTSTDAALVELLRSDPKFALVISDMTRGGDSQAAYTLQIQKQQQGDATPVVVYSRLAAAQDPAAATQNEILFMTDNPAELIRVVVTSLMNRGHARVLS